MVAIFERFTERARQVVVLANDAARDMWAPEVDSDHLLLGLIREEEGLAARVLDKLGYRLENVRAESVKRFAGASEPEFDEYFGRQLAYTVNAKNVLELALREALTLGHNYIGTEHILLGLVRDPHVGRGQSILLRDRSANHVREAVMEALRGRASSVTIADTQGKTTSFNLYAASLTVPFELASDMAAALDLYLSWHDAPAPYTREVEQRLEETQQEAYEAIVAVLDRWQDFQTRRLRGH